MTPLNPRDLSALDALHHRFETRWLSRSFPEALTLSRAALDLARRVAPQHPALHRALLDSAMAERATGSSETSQVYQEEAAALDQALAAHATQAPDDLGSADWHLYQAGRLWPVIGAGEEVQSHFKAARRIREKCLGPAHPDLARVLSRQGEMNWVTGDLQEAEKEYGHAIRLFEAAGNTDDLDYVKSLQGMAQCLTSLGRHAEADPFYEKAIRQIEQQAGDPLIGKHVLYFLLIYRADGLIQAGQIAQAEALKARADALLPKNNPGEYGFQGSAGSM